MRGTPDRGVQADIVARHQRKEVGDVRSSDRAKIVDAVKFALENGCKNKTFLGSIRRAAARGATLTAKQLDALNNILEKRGMTRISVAVYDKAKKKRRWEAFKTETNQWHADLVASLPKRPPGR
jgi:hypothetical protein